MTTNKERAEEWWRAGFDDYTGPKQPKIAEMLDAAEQRAIKEIREGLMRVIIDTETPMQALTGLGLAVLHLNKKLSAQEPSS